MKHLCLVYCEPSKLVALSPAEGVALTNESIAYDEKLGREGTYIASQALEPAKSATVVRVRNGAISTTDGPYAESKEVLAGFILLDTRDKEEAVRIASGIPMARIGTIEVRPVMALEKR